MSAQLPAGYVRPALAAALVTLVAVVVLDVAAGEGVMHTVPLGMVATALGVLRVRSAGRHRGIFGLVSGGVVAQSALHAATATIHPTHADVAGTAHLMRSEAPVTAVHLLVAALIVGAVVGVEHAYLMLASALQRAVRWLMPLSPPCIGRAAFPLPTSTLPATPPRVERSSPRGPPLLPQLVTS